MCDQHKRPLRPHLRFQGFQHSPNRSCSTVEDGRVFEIEEIQPAERAGFPQAYFPAQEFLAGLLVYLTLQKIAEMSPQELFKLLQVAIVVARSGEIPLAVRLPMRK